MRPASQGSIGGIQGIAPTVIAYQANVFVCECAAVIVDAGVPHPGALLPDHVCPQCRHRVESKTVSVVLKVP